MKRTRLSILAFSLFVVLFIASSCKTSKNASSSNNIETLLGMMEGSFNSAEQEAQDSSYYNISLHMYPVWENQDGNWFYVEQALFDKQEKPYRQRLYKVEQIGKKKFKTSIYALSNADDAIGKWKEPKWFDQFDESILAEREGCGVFLEETQPGVFEGSTKPGECGSTMRGASYATSEVAISEGQVYSWDQGFDADENQVWGAINGGYVFKILD